MRRSLAPGCAAVGVALALTAVGLRPARAADEAARAPAGPCGDLARLASPTLEITRAEIGGPASAAAPRGGPALALPEFCMVRGVLDPRTGVGGRRFGMGFELRLPTRWNGRLLFQGGGGLDGAVRPAIGFVSATSPPALARGFAVVSTDAGHEGEDATFALDQQARLDYAYNAVQQVTLEAKAIAARYYQAPPERSYFMGCSNGGRQGLMAVERFPLLFDGVVAGDPGFRLSRAAIAQMWDVAQFAKAGPRDPQGRPILSEALSQADLNLISRAVLAACDAKDGLADGMINDVKACRFDPAVLKCRDGQAQACLTPQKLAALQAVFAGAHDSRGQALYSSWPYDAGVSTPGWRMWKLGTSKTGEADSLAATLGLMSERYYFSTPPDLGLTPQTMDFDRAAARSADTGAVNDPTSTFTTSFVQHGGRLLIYQGMSDPVFSANDIIGWYGRLARDDGPPDAWARLFLVPGMNHCAGGPATDQFDALSAIQAWVESGRAPERIAATGQSFPGLSRPLCPYPAVARYTGGDPKDQSSFVCRP